MKVASSISNEESDLSGEQPSPSANHVLQRLFLQPVKLGGVMSHAGDAAGLVRLVLAVDMSSLRCSPRRSVGRWSRRFLLTPLVG